MYKGTARQQSGKAAHGKNSDSRNHHRHQWNCKVTDCSAEDRVEKSPSGLRNAQFHVGRIYAELPDRLGQRVSLDVLQYCHRWSICIACALFCRNQASKGHFVNTPFRHWQKKKSEKCAYHQSSKSDQD